MIRGESGQPRLGLRERKKLRTRQAILETAHALFAERGYDHVTVAEIAEAVHIAPKTVFVYFPSKEDLVFCDEDQMRERILGRLRERRPGETPLDAMGALIRELMAESGSQVVENLRRWRRMMGDSAVLHSRMRLLWERFEEALAEQLAEEAGESRHAPGPRVAAAQLVMIFRLLASEDVLGYLRAHPERREDAALNNWLDQAMSMVGGGIGDYLRRPPG